MIFWMGYTFRVCKYKSKIGSYLSSSKAITFSPLPPKFANLVKIDVICMHSLFLVKPKLGLNRTFFKKFFFKSYSFWFSISSIIKIQRHTPLQDLNYRKLNHYQISKKNSSHFEKDIVRSITISSKIPLFAILKCLKDPKPLNTAAATLLLKFKKRSTLLCLVNTLYLYLNSK